MTGEDLKVLRVPLAMLCAVLVAAGAAGYYTHTLVEQARAALARQKGELQAAQTRMRQSGDERDTIVKYADRYRELERLGFAGEEQRINWLDALRTANSSIGLFGINYQIGVQHAYPYAAELNPGGLVLHESIMELDMNLMHEVDLLRFLDALRAQRVGLFQVRDCSLTRTERSDTLRNQAYIAAKCNLSWLTAKPAAAAAGGVPR
jgi:hypothetical protein